MTPPAAIAISAHDRSILVEAGAGSGKTAVMAGRIAAMLAEGIAPKSIAAVTFTELAASELLIRVRDFVAELAAGTIPTELRDRGARTVSDGRS
jgi:ATP-dependent exoDNAse (exonuclease V) beta subunit